MARLAIASLFVLFIAVPARGQAQDANDFERLFARAMELHQAGDILGAIDSYKAALAITPDRVDALSNLGAAYVRLGQFDDAVAQYEAALKADPVNNTVRLNLGLAYYKSARPNQAIPQLKRVVASDPEARNAYLVLADCYRQTGQDQELVSLLKPREQIFGNDLAYAFLLGTALLETGDTLTGQKYVDRVFGAGESAEAHLLMGLAQLSQQQYRLAKTELERAVRLNPRLATVHSLYGRALLALGEQEAAERAFHAELDLNINDFEANLQLGSLRLQTGRTEEALQMLESIVAEAPDLIDAHVQLATAYNRLKRREEAERERQIIDRLNAEVQAKQRGAEAPSVEGAGR